MGLVDSDQELHTHRLLGELAILWRPLRKALDTVRQGAPRARRPSPQIHAQVRVNSVRALADVHPPALDEQDPAGHGQGMGAPWMGDADFPNELVPRS
jgi:hypothetical protein